MLKLRNISTTEIHLCLKKKENPICKMKVSLYSLLKNIWFMGWNSPLYEENNIEYMT